MFNWYSEYLLIQARQREVNRAAENRLRLAARGDSPRSRPRVESISQLPTSYRQAVSYREEGP